MWATLWLVFYCIGLFHVDACNLQEWKVWATKRLDALRSNYSVPCTALAGGALASNATRASPIKIFMFQNDELDLLADWLQYHSYLFGVANLHVIDNYSQNNHVCKLLALYQSCGMSVQNHVGALPQKQSSMTNLMREYHDKKVFLVPIDADEFITLPEFRYNHTIVNYTYAREKILNEFTKLPIDGRKYKFWESKFIVFDRDVCDESFAHGDIFDPNFRRVMHGGYAYHTRYKPHEYKTFYYSKGFIATDQGNHHGFAEHDKGIHGGHHLILQNVSHYFAHSELALLHFATSSYYGTKRKVLRAAHSYNYSDATDCPDAIAHGRSGWHYCAPAKAFRANNNESHGYYLADCLYPNDDQGVSVRIDSFTEWFRQHALTTEQLLGEPISATVHPTKRWLYI